MTSELLLRTIIAFRNFADSFNKLNPSHLSKVVYHFDPFYRWEINTVTLNNVLIEQLTVPQSGFSLEPA